MTKPINSSINDSQSVEQQLQQIINQQIKDNAGWLPFDKFMQLALYTPNLGYYANDMVKFGMMPRKFNDQGGDFVTAPEMSSLFGRCLAKQVTQILQVTNTSAIWEFGAGSGKLAEQVLTQMLEKTTTHDNVLVTDYHIVDLSSSLKLRQQQLLDRFINQGVRLHWHSSLPEKIDGAIIGNEVLDAMPVKLLVRKQKQWFERGVAMVDVGRPLNQFMPTLWQWQDKPTKLHLPVQLQTDQDYLTEIHPHSHAFVQTLAEHMDNAVAIFIDYGFGETEYYHAQRNMGTLMCHHSHRSDSQPLESVGLKDITAHVNFTDVAFAAQDAGLEVVGYSNQANFLINCGFQQQLNASDLPQRVMAQRLILEHEMGELFKVIALAKNLPQDVQLIGFSQGDKTYQL